MGQYKKWRHAMPDNWDKDREAVKERRIRELEGENAELKEILYVAHDYLKQHWDMDSAPLHKIAQLLEEPEGQALPPAIPER